MTLSLFRRRSIRISVYGKTDRGRVRGHNEDRFLVADLTAKRPMAAGEGQEHVLGRSGSLFLVADGMGGAAAGEVASEMVAEVVYTHLTAALTSAPSPRHFAACLREALESANSRIHAYAAAHPEAAGMGSTATVAGVLLAEVECDEDAELEAITCPSWALREVTHEPEWSGASLAFGA